MISLKTSQQLDKMRAAGALLYEVLTALRPDIVPGATTEAIDAKAERLIREAGASPSFKGYEGFPTTICASVDDVVVHGFPTRDALRAGQILSLDCGLILDGWQADSAFTAPVGPVDPALERLIRVTEECFWLAADQARPGNRLGDVAHAVQQHAEQNGYGVIRSLCGHGIGTEMHEDPSVPNYGTPGHGVRLRAGMTIAIEPMISLKGYSVYVKEDGWGVVTRDHAPCSHYEHTVAVTEGEPEILTYPGAKIGRFLP